MFQQITFSLSTKKCLFSFYFCCCLYCLFFTNFIIYFPVDFLISSTFANIMHIDQDRLFCKWIDGSGRRYGSEKKRQMKTCFFNTNFSLMKIAACVLITIHLHCHYLSLNIIYALQHIVLERIHKKNNIKFYLFSSKEWKLLLQRKQVYKRHIPKRKVKKMKFEINFNLNNNNIPEVVMMTTLLLCNK